MRLVAEHRPDPLGELQRFPRPPSRNGERVLLLKEKEGRGRKKKGGEEKGSARKERKGEELCSLKKFFIKAQHLTSFQVYSLMNQSVILFTKNYLICDRF